MKIVKVLHVITKLELGGAQLNTIHTVNHLNNQRFETLLISGSGGLMNRAVKESSRLIIVEKLVRSISPFKDFLALLNIFRLVKQIQPDILHTHSAKGGLIGRLAGHLAKVPVVIHTVHGFSFAPAQPLIKKKLLAWIEKKLAVLTDHLIFVAKADIKTAIEKKIIRAKPITYSLIRSGFPMESFQPRPDIRQKIRGKYQLGSDHFVCGIIAPFKAQKGLFNLIEVAASVIQSNRNVVFFIAGDGHLRKKIEKLLSEKGISGNFRLPGFIYPVEDTIECFDIGLTTALWEGLPQHLVQLRLKKKAVIASDIPGNREIIKDNLNGYLISADDHLGFCEKILKLQADPVQLSRLANHREDYSDWNADLMVERQEELYQKMMDINTTISNG